jgi:nucleotide-binding universal stress UspA family protein
MPLPDILLHIDSYPDPTPMEAIDQAVAFAGVFGGAVSLLAIQIEFGPVSNRVADYLIGLSRIAAEEEVKSLQACRAAAAHFREKTQALGVPGEVISAKRADLVAVGEEVALRARTHDLCLVPYGGRYDGQRSVAEDVIFGSGRPVLVFRPGAADLKAEIGTVLLAWDGSRPAARAMADSLPVLSKARDVRVLTITNEKTSAVAGIGAEAVRHLAAHGVKATAVEVDAAGRRVGAVLDACAREASADLMVMGAYGRSRIREFILGGATEHVLSDPALPLLLSH